MAWSLNTVLLTGNASTHPSALHCAICKKSENLQNSVYCLPYCQFYRSIALLGAGSSTSASKARNLTTVGAMTSPVNINVPPKLSSDWRTKRAGFRYRRHHDNSANSFKKVEEVEELQSRELNGGTFDFGRVRQVIRVPEA